MKKNLLLVALVLFMSPVGYASGGEPTFMIGINSFLKERSERRFEQDMKAAQNGHVRAMLGVGDYYRTSSASKESQQQMVMWYTKAADHGNQTAMYRLGNYYQSKIVHSTTVVDEENINKAIEWYQKVVAANPEKCEQICEGAKSRIVVLEGLKDKP
ncbi:MAG: tetratricopeptide repeat protein [Saezia sp.]